MSNVSKTSAELIAEAQQHYSEMNGLNSRAAEVMMELVAALESATRVPEQGEASAAIERVRAIIKPHIDWQLRRAAKFGRTKPDCGCEQCQIHAALDGAPEPEAGTKVVIGKQNRGDDDESWTFTEWEPFELEKAREEFPNSVYEVVTVFGLPVEGEKP